MKKIVLVLTTALSLWVGSPNAVAHGGGCGVGFWPFFPFGIGLGIGYSFAACNYGYRYPGYVYSQPTSYAYPPTTYNQPAASAPVASAPPESPVWVPSTPGAGKWVPEPHPYSYTPTAVGKVSTMVNPSPTVTISKPAQGMVVYTVGR